MKEKNIDLTTEVSAIVFDCDSTMSSIEGIDVLAENNNVGEQVKKITDAAMGKVGLTPELYRERLDLVKPTYDQVVELGKLYFDKIIPHLKDVVMCCQRLNKQVYVVSAGMFPAVALFASFLNIPKENVFAVNIKFDKFGNYVDFDHESPLIHNDGKRQIVSQLLNEHERIIHIGDGLNDHAVKDLVTRFIGFGGVAYREKVATFSDYYISTYSLAPVLPLILTAKEKKLLSNEELKTYAEGLKYFVKIGTD